MTKTNQLFKPGQYLFHEGDPSEAIYLIREGTVSIRKMKGAAFTEIYRAHSNEVIGELSFFDRSPRSASAVALTEVDVVEISFKSLEDAYGKIPDFMKSFIITLSTRLRNANDLIKRLQKDFSTQENKTLANLQPEGEESDEAENTPKKSDTSDQEDSK